MNGLPCKTTHPTAGQRSAPPTPPSAKIKKLLPKFSDLPAQAEEEATTAADLRVKVKQLEQQLAAAIATSPTKTVTKTVELEVISKAQLKELKASIAAAEKAHKSFERGIDALMSLAAAGSDSVQPILETLGMTIVDIKATIELAGQLPTPPVQPKTFFLNERHELPTFQRKHVGKGISAPLPGTGTFTATGVTDTKVTFVGGGRTPAQQRILDTMAMMDRLGVEPGRDSLAAWYGAHPNNKTLANNLGTLRTAGLVSGLSLTADGRKAANHTPPPTQEAAREMIMRCLTPAQRRILEALLYAERGLDRDELAQAMGAHPNNKTLANNLGALRTRQLITKGWPVRAGNVMFLRGAS